MGLKLLENLDTFRQLVRGHLDRELNGSAVRLYAVVVLDVRRNRELVELLTTQFSSLSADTGGRFLFFAPTLPKDRDPALRDSSLLGVSAAMLAAGALLGLPELDRPFLYLSPDLSKRSGFYLETSASRFAWQMRRLGTVAEDLPPESDEGALLQALSTVAEDSNAAIGSTDARPPWVVKSGIAVAMGFAPADVKGLIPKRAQEALPKSAPEALALFALDSPLPRNWQSSVATAAGTLVRSGVAREFFSKIDRVAGSLPRVLPSLAVSDLESRTRHYLEQGDALFAFLAARSDGKGPPDERDFAPSIVSWAKAVEFELNASLAHVIRGFIGVQLPESYGLHQRRPKVVPATIISAKGQVPIHFNLKARGSLPRSERSLWRAPTLGDLRLACEGIELRRDWRRGGPMCSALESVLDGCTEPFLPALKAVSQHRNDAAHPGRTFSVEEALAAKDSVSFVLESKTFQQLKPTKAQLQPGLTT